MNLILDTNSYMQLCLNLEGKDPLYLFVPTYYDSTKDEWLGYVKLPKSKQMVWGHGKNSKELEQSFNDCLYKFFSSDLDGEILDLFKPLSLGMKLIHYTDEKFDLELMDYTQYCGGKPDGLWVSVNGKEDWRSWCLSENFRTDCLIISYEIKLIDDARILYLRSSKDIFAFTRKYFIKGEPFHPKGETYQIDWNRVKKKYQGIIIDPYQWECRFDIKCSWYHGWDCTSGCIWDISCIQEFKLIEKE